MKDWLRQNKMKILVKKLVNDNNGFQRLFDGKSTEEIINLHLAKKEI